MDDLDLMLNREVLLVAGGPGSGKSYSVAHLVKNGVESGFKVVVIDADNGLAKAVKEVIGSKPANLSYFRLDSWAKLKEGVQYAMATLGPKDWLVFEMLGQMWDGAQSEYSRRVYGEDISEHLLALRADAQKELQEIGADMRSGDASKRKEANRIVSGKMQYSGMEGRTDWSVIKRMHNDEIFDFVKLRAPFNILSTTSLTPLSEDELQKGKWPLFHGVGRRPEGEKHQVHRHDTIIICDNKNNQWTWRTDLGGRGKDRGGRELVRDVVYDKVGVVASYFDRHGLEL